MNEIIPTKLSESSKKYLENLKVDLEAAKTLATKNSNTHQERYTSRYNLRSRTKTFKEGDPVIILMSDSTNKLLKRWTGPAKIRRRVSDNSYDVELDDGSVRRLHANHLRAYNERILAVGIIFESDEDFGEVVSIPVKLDNNLATIDEKFRDMDLNYLDSEQRSDILKILEKHKDIFSDRPGLCNPMIAEHVITLNVAEQNWPKQPKPYQVPPIFRAEVERQIQELLQEGLIERSVSQFAHPLVCVIKADKTIRVCTDNRYINSLTTPDRQPIRRISDILDSIGNAKFISSLDATNGFYQISLEEKSRPYTAFVFNQSYQWKRTNFGLRNASATYQRAMERLLEPHSKYAAAYIDDVTIHSLTWADHLRHLDDVLTTIKVSGFKLRLKKCKFACREIKILGHIVGNGLRKPDPEKVEAIMALKPPTTKKGVQQFIGMLSFYRIFIPNLAEKLFHLTELIKGRKSRLVEMNRQQLDEFQNLKVELSNIAALTTPIFDGKTPFIVQTDASAHTVAACLSQTQQNGVIRPLAFASQKLTKSQQNWSTIEREGFAIIFALKKFESYLIGAPVIIHTDHNPLTYICDVSPKCARLVRWALSLQKFDIISIQHIRGSENCSCDALSRLLTEDDV